MNLLSASVSSPAWLPAVSHGIPMLGALLSALLFIGVMHAIQVAESAGIAAVAGGMAEANVPVLIGLYLAIFVGMIGIVPGGTGRRCLFWCRWSSC